MNKEITKLAKEAKERQDKRVSLGAVQNFEKKISGFENDNKSFNQKLKQIASLKSKAKSEFKTLQKQFDKLRSEGDKLIKQADNLGVSAQEPFNLQAQIANIYGKGWDNDVLRFVHK